MRNNTVAVSTILFVVVCATGTTYGASATIIDFENVGNEGDLVSSIEVGGVTVEFDTEGPLGNTLPFIGEIGSPRVGFQTTTGPLDETPRNPDGSLYTEGGRFHLTDGLRQTHDYLMEFSIPVADLSLDLYDYRGDGPHSAFVFLTDRVELEVFDVLGDLITQDIHVPSEIRPIDGNVVTLGVSAASGIKSARLHFIGIEGGTAIDNIAFIPEPAGLSLLGFGLIGFLGLRRRERQVA